jgi:type VI secretion system protein VasG
MSDISRVKLFGKLNSFSRRAIGEATTFCKLRGNPYVEIVHWLHQILQNQDSDIHHIIRHFQLDVGRLRADMTRALDALPRGASSFTDLSDHVVDATQSAWLWGSLRSRFK